MTDKKIKNIICPDIQQALEDLMRNHKIPRDISKSGSLVLDDILETGEHLKKYMYKDKDGKWYVRKEFWNDRHR